MSQFSFGEGTLETGKVLQSVSAVRGCAERVGAQFVQDGERYWFLAGRRDDDQDKRLVEDVNRELDRAGLTDQLGQLKQVVPVP